MIPKPPPLSPDLTGIREVEHTDDVAELNEMLEEGGRLIAIAADPYGTMHAYVGYQERIADLDPDLPGDDT